MLAPRVGFEPTACRLTAEVVKNLSALSGVAYEKLGAIRTSLAAPNLAPKPRTHVEEIPAARRVHVFKLKICPSSARLLYGPVPVALPATVDDVHCHG
jgi:hypothetical protein